LEKTDCYLSLSDYKIETKNFLKIRKIILLEMMQFSKFCVDKQFSSTEQLNDSQIITIGIYPKEV
jgi:hypothetical protein